MAKFTKKQIDGYFNANKDGGTCFNDNYNVTTYGITSAEYHAMHSVLVDCFGLCMPNAAEKRKALKNA